jgi:hypothetical protein
MSIETLLPTETITPTEQEKLQWWRVRSLETGARPAAMKTYDVTAWKDFTAYTTLTVRTASPEAAIEIARPAIEDDADDWTDCDEGHPPIHFMQAQPNEDADDAGDEGDPAEHADWSGPQLDTVLPAARHMLALLRQVQQCPQAAPWLARFPDTGETSVWSGIAKAIAGAEKAGIKLEE